LTYFNYLGVLIDDAHGVSSSDEIYSDLNIAQLETLPETQPHRLVDLALTKADKEGKATLNLTKAYTE
jgi:hypothetical protein